MGQALYRKHRPKKLAEVVGQEHITRALTRAIEQDKLSHAYLLTGPRGVGKTSIARILAHEVNDLPYTDESVHLDIIEIDAASNRRIDEIRDLREKVHIAPTSAKYKVYIVDEVHMLTREAFNALLKTLEEPPEHVIFILATTEMHKLPDTIISRTQHFAFKPIDKSQVVAHLSELAKSESIKIDKDALELIAEHGSGSFRDSISLLDQIRNYADKVTLNDVQAMLGIAPESAVQQVIGSMASQDSGALLGILEGMRGQGIEPVVFAKQLSQALRAQVLSDKSALEPEIILSLLSNLVEIGASADPAAALEICLLKTTFVTGRPSVNAIVPAQVVVQAEKPNKSAEKPATTEKIPEVAEATVKTAEAPVTELKPEPLGSLSVDTWPAVLGQIKQQYNTMYGVLRMAEPHVEDNTLTLTFEFAFHQKRANDPKNKKNNHGHD